MVPLRELGVRCVSGESYLQKTNRIDAGVAKAAQRKLKFQTLLIDSRVLTAVSYSPIFIIWLLIAECCFMTIAYIGLGSNLGDRAGNLLLGIRGLLEAGLQVSRLSQIYESEPVETFAQPLFLNLVAELRGEPLPPGAEVMTELLEVEHSLRRTRDKAKGPRIIDLDLLLYGNETCDTKLLTLPHPRLHHRRFVLEPLAELAPHLVHPRLHQTIEELLAALEDDTEVKPWRPGNATR
jgi:2-amino-4-hydroxy-6-hydroxymethyldihydropteridine diphosphokinase